MARRAVRTSRYVFVPMLESEGPGHIRRPDDIRHYDGRAIEK